MNKPISQFETLTTITRDERFVASRNGIAYGFTIAILENSILQEAINNA